MSLSHALNLVPRRDVLEGRTPLQHRDRIEGAPSPSWHRVCLYAERDDLMALGGGNKLQKPGAPSYAA